MTHATPLPAATHPGKLGDLLWALPTLRALGGTYRLLLPATLAPTPERAASLGALLGEQPYLHHIDFLEDWQVQDTAPATPRTPSALALASRNLDTTHVRHLGYSEWPTSPLPYYVGAQAGLSDALITAALSSPWITLPTGQGDRDGKPWGRSAWIRRHYGDPGPLLRYPGPILVSFTDRWFELKLGLLHAVVRGWRAHRRSTSEPLPYFLVATQEGSRWDTAPLPPDCGRVRMNLPALAWCLARPAAALLCDNSAPMVLAAAMQQCPAVVVEPEEARHHYIFWPGNRWADGRWEQDTASPVARWIRPVLGGDGRPTFDARHTLDMLYTYWQAFLGGQY